MNEERNVSKSIENMAIFVSAVLCNPYGVAAQGMLLDYAADRVIQKYATSSCDQLKAMKGKAKSEKEKIALDFLRNDSQARIAFIDKIAAPVANKMFECGMFP